MQIEWGPGRGLSQVLPGPGGAGKRPQIDDIRSYTPPQENLKTILAAVELLCDFAQRWGSILSDL